MERRGIVVAFDSSTEAGAIEVAGTLFPFRRHDLPVDFAAEIGTVVLFDDVDGRATAIRTATPPFAPLAWRSFLFSLRGRVSLSRFWLHYWVPTRLLLLGYFGVGGAFGLRIANTPVNNAIMVAVIVLFLWIALAVEVKRWHDRGKSGLWVLIMLVPLLGPIWAFIQTGLLEGTKGANRFGPEPLAV